MMICTINKLFFNLYKKVAVQKKKLERAHVFKLKKANQQLCY